MTTTSNFGCDYVTVFSNLIEGFSSPDAGFTINPQKVSMFNPKVNLSSTSSADVTTYLWDIPSGNPSSSNLSDLSSTYPLDSVKDYIVTLYVTNIHGCTDSITNYVQVHEEVLLYAPNTFTPDGDSFNETWKVFAVGLDPERFNLKLFNRWGELIFETNDLTYGWKADYKGEDVPDGTYNWMVSAGNKYDDNKYVYRGFVNVIR
jgi:gliding motility-associated-like protein